ncbi:NADH-cytochrome b5 reductase 2 [Diplonema papillatum]|nr:NADH-cytochrome b5 reductase 2 [Diplonema papillatum]
MFRKVGAVAAGAVLSFGASSAFADVPDPARESFWHSVMSTQPSFSPSEFRKFKLINRKTATHDTQVLTFALPSTNHVMGMTVASCIVTKYTDADGKDVIRPYTPITKEQTKGAFELLVKKYPNGKMGTHLQELRLGGTVDVKGPFEKIRITANEYPRIGMLAGGTGITPMYQIISHLLNDPADQTKLTLVYANRTPEDILLKTELDGLSKLHERFEVYYLVDNAPRAWAGGIGHMNQSVLKSYLPAPGQGKVIVCGPPGMMKAVSGDKDYNQKPPTQGYVEGLLKGLGYSVDDVYKM